MGLDGFVWTVRGLGVRRVIVFSPPFFPPPTFFVVSTSSSLHLLTLPIFPNRIFRFSNLFLGSTPPFVFPPPPLFDDEAETELATLGILQFLKFDFQGCSRVYGEEGSCRKTMVSELAVDGKIRAGLVKKRVDTRWPLGVRREEGRSAFCRTDFAAVF